MQWVQYTIRTLYGNNSRYTTVLFVIGPTYRLASHGFVSFTKVSGFNFSLKIHDLSFKHMDIYICHNCVKSIWNIISILKSFDAHGAAYRAIAQAFLLQLAHTAQKQVFMIKWLYFFGRNEFFIFYDRDLILSLYKKSWSDRPERFTFRDLWRFDSSLLLRYSGMRF